MPNPLQPMTRMEAFQEQFGAGTPRCPRCGGTMRFEWDEHQPVAHCWACSFEAAENPIPPVDTIEDYEPGYYRTDPRFRLEEVPNGRVA